MWVRLESSSRSTYSHRVNPLAPYPRDRISKLENKLEHPSISDPQSGKVSDCGQSAGKKSVEKNTFVFTDLNPGLAYLLGVYLGDGSVDRIFTSRSVTEPSYYFKLGSIDRDFVEYVRLVCSKVVTPRVPEIRKCEKGNGGKNDVYRFSLGCADFCRWLLAQCEGKSKVPDIIPRKESFLTKRFLEGIVDSEGYVSYQENHNWLMSGFAMTSSWTPQIADLLLMQGVKIGKGTQYHTKQGTLVFSYRFNIRTYYEAGLQFHLARKHNRVLQYFKNPQRLPLKQPENG